MNEPLRVVIDERDTATASTRTISDRVPDPVQRFRVDDLVALVPGSSRRMWLDEWIPTLIAVGVMRKLGRGFIAKRSEIERWLLGRFDAQTFGRGRRR